jgi:hypothetical protein
VISGPRSARDTQSALLERNILAGYPLDSLGGEFESCLLLCCTEINTTEQIDQLAAGLAEIGGGR